MPIGNRSVRLGTRRYDVTHRCLVMGILHQGDMSTFDSSLRRAEQLVSDGVQILDVASPNSGEEQLERVVRTVDALVDRFDVPVSASTSDARVLSAACAAGAVLGNDLSGFSDPGYLAVAARAGASVVATYGQAAAGARAAEPYDDDDAVGAACALLAGRAEEARVAGLVPEQIILGAGVDFEKAAALSVMLLRGSDRLAALGYPLLLSVSNTTFLGVVAYGVTHGCRIVRVHDVAGTVRVVRAIERILEAEGGAEGRYSG